MKKETEYDKRIKRELLFFVKMGIISLIVFIPGVWYGMSIMPIIVPFWIGGLITLSLTTLIISVLMSIVWYDHYKDPYSHY